MMKFHDCDECDFEVDESIALEAKQCEPSEEEKTKLFGKFPVRYFASIAAIGSHVPTQVMPAPVFYVPATASGTKRSSCDISND